MESLEQMFFEYLKKHEKAVFTFCCEWLNSLDFNCMVKDVEAEDKRAVEKWLNKAWFQAPDKPWIRETTGFFEVCNLCDESYIK